MSSEGGKRAISGFLFQVLVGGALRAAGECEDVSTANASELDALVELTRTGEVLHEVADEDLLVRRNVVDPAITASAEVTLVQVKYSSLGTSKHIATAELGSIVTAFAIAKRRIEKKGEHVAGYVLVTNRVITGGEPPSMSAAERVIYRQLRRVEDAQIDDWHAKLTAFARRFGMQDDEIDAGRQRLFGLIFETTSSGASRGVITRTDLLRCLCNGDNAQELRAEKQASAIQRQVQSFDVDCRNTTVRREQIATIERDCAGRALVVIEGPGGSGKTAALYDWTRELADSANTKGPLVALLAAHELPDEWLADAVREWNPAVYPTNANEALERLTIAGGGAMPLLHLGLDGVDEYPADATTGRVRRLAKWFLAHDRAALAGDRLRARLVVTCRNANDFARDTLMLLRSGGALSAEGGPKVITFERFSEAELRELLRINFTEFERQLLHDEGAEGALPSGFATTDSSPAVPDGSGARHPVVELLLDPVMWRAFCEISPATRERLVAGHVEEERELAKHFCDRFIEKARIRTGFERTILRTALSCIAADHKAEGRRFRTANQWQQSAQTSSGLSLAEARRLSAEAASGGLIREETGSRWDWRSDAVEVYLANLFTP
jgi:hypothetical protein